MLSPLEILGPGGRIAARLPNYEHRREQLAMAEAVDRAIRERHHLVVEAGTGVGKSFAYLVPAILAATATEEGGEDAGEDSEEPSKAARPPRVIVSTHTISLQEQLMQKDLPLLASVIPQEFSAVLVKGRGNYVSLRRLQNALSRAAGLFRHRGRIRATASGWPPGRSRPADGSLSDLDFRPLPAVWDEVASDHGNCMGRSCPMYGKCFYYKARRRMQHAQILVVNHALFFTDLALRRQKVSILPKYDVVVLDEAHTIEAVAGDHLGLSITNGQVDYTLRRLYNDRTNRGLAGAPQAARSPKRGVGVPRPGVGASSKASPPGWMSSPRATAASASRASCANPLGAAPEAAGRPRLRHHGQATSIEPEQRQDFTAAANRLEALAPGHRRLAQASRCPTRSTGSTGA